MRPGSVTDPAPQDKVERHIVEHRVEAFRHLDMLIPEQVIEVPKISSSPRRSRRRRVPLVQTEEQLVEVPEFVQLAALFQQQIVDAPGSPQGFLPGQDYLLVWEQNMDIPVLHGHGGRAGRGGLLGLRPDPNSAAPSAHSPGAADEVFTWFFALFPWEKVRGSVRTRGRN